MLVVNAHCLAVSEQASRMLLLIIISDLSSALKTDSPCDVRRKSVVWSYYFVHFTTGDEEAWKLEKMILAVLQSS